MTVGLSTLKAPALSPAEFPLKVLFTINEGPVVDADMKMPPPLSPALFWLIVLASIVTTVFAEAMAPPLESLWFPSAAESPPSVLPLRIFSVPLVIKMPPPWFTAVLALIVLAPIVTTALSWATMAPPTLVAVLPFNTLPLRTFNVPLNMKIPPPASAVLELIVLASMDSVVSWFALIAPPNSVVLPLVSVTPEIVTSAPVICRCRELSLASMVSKFCPKPSIVKSSVTIGSCVPPSWIVCSEPKNGANVILSAPGFALAKLMASRSEVSPSALSSTSSVVETMRLSVSKGDSTAPISTVPNWIRVSPV